MSQSNSYTVTFADRVKWWCPNLSEEVMPQNVVQVGSVFWDLGQQAGNELLRLQ